MTHVRKTAVFFAIIAAIAGLGWQLWRSDVSDDAPIRIAINPWMGYEYLYLAEQKGFFAEEGLSVKLLQYSSLEDVRAAFERGQVDAMTSTVVEVIQANALTKSRAQVVLVTDFSYGADVILAHKAYTSMKELKGKKIGVEKASLGMFMLVRALQKSGMGLKDVQALTYDQPSMAQAMAEGKVDAIVTYPPFSIEIIKQEAVNKVFDSKVIPGEVLDVVSVREALLKSRPEIAAALMRVWDKSLSYADSNPKDAIATMARRENISVGEFEENLKGVHIVGISEQANLMKSGGKLEQVIVQMSRVLQDADELVTPVERPGDYIFRKE